ncbi:uncharacterized protein [Littorina saxatilis]|uniref:Chitin-binding type-2 domain-containing protein n=1 Tax=Littorina saxatilis TaxID=31220 RepID=A0AAN9B9U4_9CAEN
MDNQHRMYQGVVALLLVATACVQGQQGLFRRQPLDGDACKTFKFTSQVAAVARVLQQRVSPIACPRGQVVSSDGGCVPPEDSDRCQHAVVFDQNYVLNKCARNPKLRFADPYSCANYFDCSVGITSIGCPIGLMYDDVNKKCDIFTEVQCGERSVEYTNEQLALMCSLHPNRIIVRSNTCNSFYNCSMSEDPEGRMLPYHGECKYLTLLDTETKLCLPVEEVQCNTRRELKNPCDLQQFQCGRSSHCRPCFVDQPDCTNLPDGDNPFPGQPFTPKYARCSQGRTLGAGTCVPASPTEPRLFDPRSGGCAPVSNIPRSLGGAGPDF